MPMAAAHSWKSNDLADQQRIADHMKRAGHRFEVVDSVEAAISVPVVRGVVRGMAVQ